MPEKQAQIAIVFPHQLYEDGPLRHCERFYLVEESLYFNQYNFHKQKITYHRATMKWYAAYLAEQGKEVNYIDAIDDRSDIRMLISRLSSAGVQSIAFIDPTDDWLTKRITASCDRANIQYQQYNSPNFINTPRELQEYFEGRKRFFQADFYAHQRTTRNILMETEKQPLGGKWSFDAENRKKFPKNTAAPAFSFQSASPFYEEAESYTQKHFSKNYGGLDRTKIYPATHAESKAWLRRFLEERFELFGVYEDAIVAKEHILYHSVLTPMLNTGLLSPVYILQEVLHYASNHEIPLNSLEGFIRQLIGWREYMRAVYLFKGVEERNKNFWGFKRKIPESFWTGTTGIAPVDRTIEKVLRTGYCHHIERLMVLGNFMLLCEFDPDEVYRWFMEMFIDAYDWVMVPNVYGMSQFSDGGLMSTKPYISGSNYLMKMSDYPRGDWQPVWDGLFWRFMHVHRSFFLSNPRLSMLVKSFDKMPAAKQAAHLANANAFLDRLDFR